MPPDVCPLCGAAHAVCPGRISNRTMPVGYGWDGPEPGPPTGVNRPATARVYDAGLFTLEVQIPMAEQRTADKRYYVTKDGRIVEDTDPERAQLLVGKGGNLDQAIANFYALNGITPAFAEATAVDAPADEPKALPRRTNKARAAAEDKAG
jgi:hypothetical protein